LSSNASLATPALFVAKVAKAIGCLLSLMASFATVALFASLACL